jgi:hypothetical protein
MKRLPVFGPENTNQARQIGFSKKSGRFASELFGTMETTEVVHFNHLYFPKVSANAAETAGVYGGFDGLCWVANLSTSDLWNPA